MARCASKMIMKLTSFKRNTALIMAFLFLMTATGFSMNIHYCGGELKDIAFFSDEVECSMMAEMKMAKSCPMHDMVATDCCEDQDVQVAADSPESYVTQSISLQPDWEPAPTQEVLTFSGRTSPELLRSYTTYRPPPIDRDIFVLVQSFLL